MKKNNEITFREAFGMHWRACKLFRRLCPHITAATLMRPALLALTPYVGIWFSARLINELSGRRDPESLWKWVILTLIFTFLAGMLNELSLAWKNSVHANFWYDKMAKVYTDKLLDLDFAALDDQHTYDLRYQIQQNENWTQGGFPRVLMHSESVVSAVFMVAGAVALTVSLFTQKVPAGSGAFEMLNHPLSAAVIGLLLLAVTFLAPACIDKVNAYWMKYAKEGLASNRFYAYFGGAVCRRSRAMDVRMYGQQRLCAYYAERGNFYTTKSELAKAAAGPMGMWSALAGVLSVVFTGLVYVFVCLKAWAGAFGVGSVTQYVASITALSQGVSMLLTTMIDIRTNAVFLKSSYEFLDIPNEMYQGSLTTEKRRDRKYEIEFRDVSFRYPGQDTYALRHVSVKFQVGERMAVVGRNGSGKTTFIKLLCRLYDPTEGEILLNGIDIRKYRYDDYLSIFSVVFQDFQLMALPLGQNVAVCRDYDAERVRDCLEKAGFSERLSGMTEGLETYLYKDFRDEGVEISGGEAQKLAIARALYKDAPFIILDEPTASLDPIAEAEIYARFSGIVGDRTAIYISHRLSSCRFCDDILVFDEGNVVQRGSHEQLVQCDGGRYHELWYAQAQYYHK